MESEHVCDVDLENVDVFNSLSVRVKYKPGLNEVWKHFGILTKKGVCTDEVHNYCALCLRHKSLKRYKKNTSTGNLRMHLVIDHKLNLTSKNIDQTQQKLTTMFFGSTTNQPSSSGSSNIALTNTSTISQRKENIFSLARQLTLWLCRDLLPFNTVENSGFKDFAVASKLVKFADEIPSTSTISKASLDDVYRAVYNEFESQLILLPTTVAITFDFWTDKVKRSSYVTYTCHWMHEFTLRNMSLKTEAFPHPHKAEDIKVAFEALLVEFKLTGKTIVAVTDGGTNIVKACKLLKLDRLPCAAHSLHNLIMHDLMKDERLDGFNQIVVKIKKGMMALTYKYDYLLDLFEENKRYIITGLVNSLVNLQAVLEAEEDITFEDEGERLLHQAINDKSSMLSLKNANITRWCSTLTMLTSIITNHEIVVKCLQKLRKYDLIMEDHELLQCKEMARVLCHFSTATDFLQGQCYSTLNTVLIFLPDIQKTIEKDLTDESDFVKTIAHILNNAISKRFPVNDHLIAATFLDPSMQKLPIIDQFLQQKSTTISDLLKEMSNKMKVNFIVREDSAEKQAVISSKNVNKKMEIRLDLLQRHINFEQKKPENLESEIAQYSSVVKDLVEDPIIWWKENEKDFPQLAELAKIFLSIPATSAPAERAFSAAGLLLTAKRSRLHPTKAKKILFIHDNFDNLAKYKHNS